MAGRFSQHGCMLLCKDGIKKVLRPIMIYQHAMS